MMESAAPLAATALSESDRRELLRIARVAIKEYFITGRLPPGAPHRPALLVHAPAFVTLHVDGRLRGCIGCTEPAAPLYRTVAELAVSAAHEDDRFTPLRREEMPQLKVTVSVLSPAQRLVHAEEIEVGRHGLLISRGPCRGLLLPQVAAEHGWTAETFLQEVCHKAGLPSDAWKDAETQIERFTADVFSDP